MAEKKSVREKPIPDYKKDLVVKIAEKIKSSRTVLVASTKGLPASQFQMIKKKLRGKAEIMVAKKSIVVRAISGIEKGALQNLKEQVGADVCLIFSGLEAFELSGLLVDNQSPARAKAGDIAPADIDVEPGPTDLIPGPAISELGSVGLKVAVEDGKLAIKQGATIVKEGEVIDGKASGVMGKLGITPMKVGFIPVAAYDSESDMIYTEIKIDKEGTLADLRSAIGKAFGFAVNIGYTVKETISYFISKAAMEEKALAAKVDSGEEKPAEESKEEKAEEKPAGEDKKEDVKEEKQGEKKDA